MTLHKMLKEHNEYCKVGLIYYWWDSIFDKKKKSVGNHCNYRKTPLCF